MFQMFQNYFIIYFYNLSKNNEYITKNSDI
jgi:hypothetical protein